MFSFGDDVVMTNPGVSDMAVELRAFTTGWLTLPLGFMLAGRDGTIKVPVCSYLVTHRRGQVVFDTGLHPATQHDPAGHVGELLASFHQFDFHPGEDIAARLRAVDVDPGSVTHVVNSHLHFDHCGGNAQLSNATIVCQHAEWDAAQRGGVKRGDVAADFDTGQPLTLIDGEHDLFGDGTVVCIPTPGHTPGHHSLRVRTEQGGEFVLCGDACYLKQTLDDLILPGVIADKEAAMTTLHLFRRLRDAGATLMFGHDPDIWAGVAEAPIRLG